jgi:hypothetical protein
VDGHSLRASRSQPFEHWCHRFCQILRPQTGKLPILDKARLVGGCLGQADIEDTAGDLAAAIRLQRSLGLLHP